MLRATFGLLHSVPVRCGSILLLNQLADDKSVYGSGSKAPGVLKMGSALTRDDVNVHCGFDCITNSRFPQDRIASTSKTTLYLLTYLLHAAESFLRS
jgi:hypothetical protein